MAAPSTSLSLSLSLDSAFQPLLFLSSHNFSAPSFSLSLHKSHPLSLKSFPRLSPPHALDPSIEVPPIRGGPFLDPGSFSKLRTLKEFRYVHQFDHGRLEIRSMEAEEVDPASLLLAKSFAESMWWAGGYVPFLAFLVRQYVIERRARIPHTTILLGFYKERDGEEEARLACIAEISFDALGANAAVPTPVPPQEYPYLSNMTVRKSFRRRGIGGHLLKACEELITQMKAERKVYLHCRMIDDVPFRLYKKAGYKVVKTDSILIWLTLQRRKYLMLKELPPIPDDRKSDNTDYNDQPI
ncbi:GCN5-related N-acetyltransferase 5, chloroplastic [Elaeis guineensis]|uniref:Uncharacterized protein LOC105039174 n=1 Tax=Elaeis guineensis var. tenera TaxID=51953 RepID=A0A6I9QR53_ELAGV|nr:uncharacterized protein LOC105039174 [Elaeis guineensis]